ncbi:Cdc7p-Dbf4p kinase complex regulatory subunit [Coemansia spiralis]|uniref:Cdc7p-Dbf4p kinase complex regulatory subunit n=2 Tax=Coemansia TaxID=4863 RepID=A0A9W8GBX9_9FUNG|nr:hypothetical protein BX070DRAFT_103473 [Coemansia spiralis]KAJ1996323.1 Cdc7p-Dbf4p kinase complex regulatory subunit [Coemansia umbellata]KAJ2625918.1 Cdc7p-Dbf4p kinase complex regulatory subunit [Coemansia sp. RSA 1358]KAJ2680752.1 Cdc7p-Dbf4p kinase complex regulatory subunit [Coemansia spiralis]
MSSRKLTFDASRPSVRNLGASPAARNSLLSTSQNPALLSPTRALSTPTRVSQRATLPRPQSSTSLSRRNPLQTIIEKERQQLNLQQPQQQQQQQVSALTAVLQQENTVDDGVLKAQLQYEQSASTVRASTQVTADQQREQRARVAEWVFAYRRAFPSFVFYFEGVDENTVQRLSAPIRVLGAKVETFFSAQTVTHVIVEDLSKINDENSTSSSHVVSLAKRFQLRIWDLSKLETRILAFLLPGYNDIASQSPSVLSAKRKLNEAFSAEKMYAMRHKTFEGTAVSHSVDFYYFKYFYVLVEDSTHLNRPAIVEDYRPPEPGNDPPWPKLYMVPKGRCPFVQYEDPTTSSKGSESDLEYNKENVTPEPEDTLPTAHLLSKTPVSRAQAQTPRRKTWAPGTIHTTMEKSAPAVPVHKKARHDNDDDDDDDDGDYENLRTPTRLSRATVKIAVGASAAGRGNFSAQHHTAAAVTPSLVVDSNASGINQSLGVTSTSTAFHLNALDPLMQQSLLQNLNGGRVTHLSKLEQPVAGSRAAGSQSAAHKHGRLPPAPRTKKPTIPVRRPAVAMRGYCENCHVKFEDMVEHVKSPQHVRFATNERNWLELDTLLDCVKRPLRKPQSVARSSSADCSTLVLSSDKEAAVLSTPAVVESTIQGVELLHSNEVQPALAVSTLASVDASWGANSFIRRAFGPAYATSTQMLASGRLSTEYTDNTEAGGASGCTLAQRRDDASGVSGGNTIDLAFSNTNPNSSCDSPKQPSLLDLVSVRPEASGPGTSVASASCDNVSTQPSLSLLTPVPQRSLNASSSIEALVMSLETPDFGNNRVAQPYAEATTLVGDTLAHHSSHRHYLMSGSHQLALETPTRNSALSVLGGATLNQPSRVSRRALRSDNAKDNDSPISGVNEKVSGSSYTRRSVVHSENDRL